MPNWCSNKVYMEDIANLPIYTDGNIDFEKIIPMPESIKNNMDSGDWYDWSCENWGTKWNSTDTHIVDDDCIEFDTAWSPPIPVLERLSKENPDKPINHYYIDEGVNFAGEASYLNGNCEYYDYDYGTPESISVAEEIWGYDYTKEEEEEITYIAPAFIYIMPAFEMI